MFRALDGVGDHRALYHIPNNIIFYLELNSNMRAQHARQLIVDKGVLPYFITVDFILIPDIPEYAVCEQGIYNFKTPAV